MQKRRRFNLMLAFAVLAGGLPLMARPASASVVLYCPTESCGDQCYTDCYQPDCSKSYCNSTTCYDNLGGAHPFDTGCQSET